MAGQLWGGTIPGAQAFLRSFIGANQPEGFEYHSASQADTSTAKDLPSDDLANKGPTGQSVPATSNVKSTSPTQSDTITPLVDTNSVAREGLPQEAGDKTMNHVLNALDSSDLPVWKQKIIDKNEANKKEINGIGDDFTNKAIDRIENLPEERREKAAEEYLRSTDYIMKGVKRVMDFSANVSRYF